VQLALNVSDIDAAVDHYSKVFDTEPNKRQPGYANFAIADPPLKLVLFENESEPGTLNHLGTEMETTDQVTATAQRLSATGIDTAVEEAQTCCYASQDKAWTTDPDGLPWEIYTVLSDSDDFGHSSGQHEQADEVCCTPEAGTTESVGSCC
jgi:uncharacterized glyoxalase superfamily protein PhnB